MMYLLDYLKDGADAQPRAVLMLLQELLNDNPEIRLGRWENCREQGYVVSLQNYLTDKQLNIAFFEHRNSYEIHAVKWEQYTINSPTIETAEFGDIYTDKNDTSFHVPYISVGEMATWISTKINMWNEEQINMWNDEQE